MKKLTPQYPFWQLVIKRLADILGASFLLLLALPLFIIAAIGIMISSRGPVIFKQKRIGLRGKEFMFYKLRSMVSDAEQKRQELIDRNIMTGPAFKIKDDPRITSFGRFLRQTSMDELPQLWNVIKGDMSLVGPRPPVPDEVLQYNEKQKKRLDIRPGLTCLWQIRGRNTVTSFNEWVRLDLEYIEQWSLWLDVAIFLKTIPVVVMRIGAW